MRHGVLSAISAAALAAGGCYGPAPLLRVTDARVGDRSADGTVIEFTIDAENSSPEAMPLREVSYEVLLDGKPVFSATRSAEVTLRRFGVHHIRLPAAIPAGLEPGPGTREYSLRGTLTYESPGKLEEILFENDIRRPTTGIAGSGSVELPAR